MKLTRGYRNNNPGNIRKTPDKWKGEVEGTDTAFKKFMSMPYGYRAIFVLLRTYIFSKGLNTIRKIIPVYAPKNENDTEAYIRAVSVKTGLRADEPIDFQNEQKLISLVAAISKVENGIEPDITDIHKGLNLYKTA
jgi:hypothetical protein